MSNENNHGWTAPGNVLAFISLVVMIFGSWLTLERRISTVESNKEETSKRLDRMEDKIDRLLLATNEVKK